MSSGDEIDRDQLVASIEELATADPSGAVALGDSVREDELTLDQLVRKRRATGVARRALRDADGSLHDLETALTRAREQRVPEPLLGQVLTSLAPTLAYVGRTEDALQALAEAEDLVDGFDRAVLLFQRAGLRQRVGTTEAALSDYDEAIPVLRASDDPTWVADARQNRAILLVDSGRLDEAHADLSHALAIYEAVGSSGVADALHNLGLVAVRRGDIAASLDLFDRADVEFERLGVDLAALPSARCEALLAAGLYDEAGVHGERALRAYREERLEIDEGEALLWISLAARSAGDLDAALDAAADADRLFSNQRRPGWQATARSAILHIKERLGSATASDVAMAGQVADRLQVEGKVYAEADARILIAQLAMQTGDLARAARELSTCRWVARRGTVGLRVAWWLATARSRRATGNRAAASRAVTAGLAALADARASLGSIDVRCHVSAHAEALIALGTDLAVSSGDPWRIAQFFDNSRVGSLSSPPIRPSTDPNERAALSALRSVAARLADPDLRGTETSELAATQRRLEREVLERQRRRRGLAGAQPHPVTRAELRDLVDRRNVVLYGVHQSRLLSIAGISGQVRRADLGSVEPVQVLAAELRGRLTRLAELAGPGSEADLIADVETARAELARRLLSFDLDEVDDLVLLPSPELFGVPWACLPGLYERSFAVSPSAQMLTRPSLPPTWEPEAVGVVLGPGLGEAARAESEGVLATWRACSIGEELPATVDGVISGLRRCDVVHLACHSSFRAQSPQFSSLQLVDGPLMTCEFDGLAGAPSIVVLSGCDAGMTDATRSHEVYGFVSSLLIAGSRAVVAPTVAIADDDPTAQVMVDLHSQVARGLPVRTALAEARRRAAGSDLSSWVAAASLICFGDEGR